MNQNAMEHWITSLDELEDDGRACVVGRGSSHDFVLVGFTVPPHFDAPVIPVVIPVGSDKAVSWQSVRACLAMLEDILSGEPRNWMHASFIGRMDAEDRVEVEHYLKRDSRVLAALQDISMHARRNS